MLDSVLDILALSLSVIGGVVGLSQWVKGNDYKRAEIAKELITQIRDDKEIAFIMDLIDWPDKFEYDGEFHVVEGMEKPRSKDIQELYNDLEMFKSGPNQKLFIAIDRTLAHFNYICYLHELKIFKKEDMAIFMYEIRRLFDNEHICNYLYSLTLWSMSLHVECSYSHLVSYGIKMGYVSRDFYDKSSSNYTCFLKI